MAAYRKSPLVGGVKVRSSNLRSYVIKASHTTNVPHLSPFRYPGGKSWLAPQVVAWLSYLNVDLLVEPFAGGASVSLFSLTDGLVDDIIINEIDPLIHNFWMAALNNTDDLCKLISEFEASERRARDLIHYLKNQEDLSGLDTSEKAFLTLLRNRISRNGVMTNKSGVLKKGDTNGLFSRWYPETMIRRIRRIASFKAAIHIQSVDGISVITANKDKDCAFFVDPPYVNAGRYLYNYNSVDHRKIFEECKSVADKVLITYDKTEEIVSLARENNFDSVVMTMMGGMNAKKEELLISGNLDWSEVFCEKESIS